MIRFENVAKTYDRARALDHISFEIPSNARAAFFGPSGAGKSTALRLIAGLIQPDEGQVICDTDSISMVFQNHRLFDHLTVLDNIAYGADVRKLSKNERITKAKEWAAYFQIEDALYQRTDTLSGGQMQRVGLARAFMKDPDILLLDESFSAMDIVLKTELIQKILEQHQKRPFTLISISHSLQEVEMLAGQVIVLQNGKLVDQGSWQQVFAHPKNLFEAAGQSFSSINILDGSLFGTSGYAAIQPYAIEVMEDLFETSKPESSKEKRKQELVLKAAFIEQKPLGSLWQSRYEISGQPVLVLSSTPKKGNYLVFSQEDLMFFNPDGTLHSKEISSRNMK